MSKSFIFCLSLLMAVGCRSKKEANTDNSNENIADEKIDTEPEQIGKRCHDEQSFYCNDEKKSTKLAITATGKSIEYVPANGESGFKVWKEVNGERILRANGLDEWAKKLNFDGKGQSPEDFTEYSSIAGIACPTNVYIEENNKFSTTNCVYYTAELEEQGLNQAGSSQTDLNTLGLEGWSAYGADATSQTDPKWFTGNIKTCADKGMRLPTIYETSTKETNKSGYPTNDGTPLFSDENGIPSLNFIWTSSANASNTSSYWIWRGSSSAADYLYYSSPVVCLLP